MTFEELDSQYPNGFCDARITGIDIDYAKRTATVHLSLRRNMPESQDRDLYSRAVLTTRNFYYVSVEPPDSDHLFYPSNGNITVDGFTEDAEQFSLVKKLEGTLPVGAFVCRLFVHDWNSFIRIAAPEAELEWV
jgi:hypothetical protein